MQNEKKMITGEDIADLRDELGIKAIDLYWLFGTIGGIKVTGERSKQPISDPAVGILTRYLAKYPDENPLPNMPDFNDLYKKIQTMDFDRVTNRRVGVIFGKSGWSGNRWFHSGIPAPLVQRLFYLLYYAIEEEGQKGLEKFLAIVDEEARARGFSNGLEGVFKNGNWTPSDNDNENDEATT